MSKVAETRAQFAVAYTALGIVAAAAVLALGKMAFTTTHTVRTYVDRPVVSMAAVQATFGRPGQVVDGSQLGLKPGTVCKAYSRPDGFFLLCAR